MYFEKYKHKTHLKIKQKNGYETLLFLNFAQFLSFSGRTQRSFKNLKKITKFLKLNSSYTMQDFLFLFINEFYLPLRVHKHIFGSKRFKRERIISYLLSHHKLLFQSFGLTKQLIKKNNISAFSYLLLKEFIYLKNKNEEELVDSKLRDFYWMKLKLIEYNRLGMRSSIVKNYR